MTKLLAVLGRRWTVLLIGMTVGLVAGLLSPSVSASGAEQMWAAQRMIVANPGTPAPESAAQDALKVTRGEIPETAAELLEYEGDPSRLARSVKSTYQKDTSSILLRVEAGDRSTASKRVDAFAEAFLKVINGRMQAQDIQRINRAKENLSREQTALADLHQLYPQLSQPDFLVAQSNPFWNDVLRQRTEIQNRISEAETEVRSLEDELERDTPYEVLGAEPPTPVATGLVSVPESRPARGVLLGLLGVLLAAALVMILERSIPRIDTREELAELTRLPILGEIGYLRKARRSAGVDGALVLEGPWAEPYRRVRSAIQFVQENARLGEDWHPQAPAPSPALAGHPSVFLVTSASPSEGKSTTAALLAMALAEIGEPTVLIGGDFRRPQADRLVGGEASPTMQDLAVMDLERASVDEVVQTTPTENLYLASPGRATREVTPLIAAVKEVATEAVRRQCTVVIDSSPLTAANDTVDLLPVIDYVLLVVRAGKTSEKDFVDTVATLERMDSQILGVILIGTRFDGRHSTYYYDYYSPQST